MRRIIIERGYPQGRTIGGSTYVEAVTYVANNPRRPDSGPTMHLCVESVEAGVKTSFMPCWYLHELLPLYLAEQERLSR